MDQVVLAAVSGHCHQELDTDNRSFASQSIPLSTALRGKVNVQTVLLLTISNVFMTFAWYGHLKYKNSPLPLVIFLSWMIALFEYCFQVPANRIGHRTFSAAQLKVMQEVITLVVFCAFSLLYLREPMRWNYIVGFLLILVAVGFVFGFVPDQPDPNTPNTTSATPAKPTRPT
jgi:uncharacterized protein